MAWGQLLSSTTDSTAHGPGTSLSLASAGPHPHWKKGLAWLCVATAVDVWPLAVAGALLALAPRWWLLGLASASTVNAYLYAFVRSGPWLRHLGAITSTTTALALDTQQGVLSATVTSAIPASSRALSVPLADIGACRLEVVPTRDVPLVATLHLTWRGEDGARTGDRLELLLDAPRRRSDALVLMSRLAWAMGWEGFVIRNCDRFRLDVDLSREVAPRGVVLPVPSLAQAKSFAPEDLELAIQEPGFKPGKFDPDGFPTDDRILVWRQGKRVEVASGPANWLQGLALSVAGALAGALILSPAAIDFGNPALLLADPAGAALTGLGALVGLTLGILAAMARRTDRAIELDLASARGTIRQGPLTRAVKLVDVQGVAARAVPASQAGAGGPAPAAAHRYALVLLLPESDEVLLTTRGFADPQAAYRPAAQAAMELARWLSVPWRLDTPRPAPPPKTV